MLPDDLSHAAALEGACAKRGDRYGGLGPADDDLPGRRRHTALRRKLVDARQMQIPKHFPGTGLEMPGNRKQALVIRSTPLTPRGTAPR